MLNRQLMIWSIAGAAVFPLATITYWHRTGIYRGILL